jgi:hypothetical protein
LHVRGTTALGVVLLAAVTACGSSGTSPGHATAPSSPAPITTSGPPLTVTTSSDARSAVEDARLNRTLVIDGGKLRLDPTSDTPRVSEDRAVRLWATGLMPGSITDTEQAVVVLAKVTMQVPVSVAGMALRPATTPTFKGRDAWVMLWQPGPHSCPALPVRTDVPTGGREPQPVEIIAADGSGEGVSYQTRGSFCAEPISGPSATPAVYAESLPWTVKGSTPTSMTIAYTVPACGLQTGVAGPNGSSYTVWVGATVMMGAGPCPGAKPGPATSTVGRRPGTNPTHGATGLLVGRSSEDFTKLTYFDGRTRTLPVSQ